jgi:hypothetical protein
MVVVVSACGLLVEGLLVVVVAVEYLLVLLAELGGLLLQLGRASEEPCSSSRSSSWQREDGDVRR